MFFCAGLVFAAAARHLELQRNCSVHRVSAGARACGRRDVFVLRSLQKRQGSAARSLLP